MSYFSQVNIAYNGVTVTASTPLPTLTSTTAIPAGTANIGHVYVDNVASTPINIASIPAGSNAIGTVNVNNISGTPVQISAIPTGTNVIGHVFIDNIAGTPVNISAIPTGTNAIGTVTVNNIAGTPVQISTIPTGSNVIGHVIVDSMPAISMGAIAAGTAFIGRSGATAWKASYNITRLTDTTQYAVDDAISAATPATPSIDLATFGAANGQFIQITNARVISSVKGSVTDLNANIWVFNVAFAPTTDNTAFSVDDTTAQAGGVVIPCLNAFRNALNHRCVSDCGSWIMQLAEADTKIYLGFQAANTYTPVSGEVLYIVLEGLLL